MTGVQTCALPISALAVVGCVTRGNSSSLGMMTSAPSFSTAHGWAVIGGFRPHLATAGKAILLGYVVSLGETPRMTAAGGETVEVGW